MRAALKALSVLVLTAAIACEPTYPEGRALPKGISGEELVDEYYFNEDRAKRKFNDQWYLVSAGPVLQVTKGDRVNFKYHNGRIQMKFKSKDEASEISPNQPMIIALCKVQGKNTHYLAGSALYMDGCHWANETGRTSEPGK